MQVLFGVLLLVYVPNVDSYEGYIPLVDPIDDNKNEKPLGEHVCPERYANILSSKPSHFSFSWLFTSSALYVAYFWTKNIQII